MSLPNERTEAIYTSIVDYRLTRGVSPTYREIAEDCGIDQARISYHLDHLERVGRVTRVPGQNRNIRLGGTRETRYEGELVYQGAITNLDIYGIHESVAPVQWDPEERKPGRLIFYPDPPKLKEE